MDVPETADADQQEAVFAIVRGIPPGRVMSYGQVGDAAGVSARMAGWALQGVPDDVPWQRVVGADGYLRIGRRSPHLQKQQRAMLEAEGDVFKPNGCVDMARFQVGAAPVLDL